MASSTDALKVLILGNSGVGKSSLVMRFVRGTFEESVSLEVTISGAFFTKSVMVGASWVKLHLWDTAGSEAYHSVTRMYYRNAQAAIVCYDISDFSSFAGLHYWTQELIQNVPECRLYVCGCKLDLQKDRRRIPFLEARQFAEDRGAAIFETSSRTGDNVEALFGRICCDAVDWNFISIIDGSPYQLEPPKPADSFSLKASRRGGSSGAASRCQSQNCLI